MTDVLTALRTYPVAAGETVHEGHPAHLMARADEPCKRCRGNGEIVTDWDIYLHPPANAPTDAGTAECPDCEGRGSTDIEDEEEPAHADR